MGKEKNNNELIVVVGVLRLDQASGYIRVPSRPKMPDDAPLASSLAACCWMPLFALSCEEARRPELRAQPCALLSDVRRVWQVSAMARRVGVKPGVTVSQAIGLCPTLRLCEPDPVHYDEQFTRLLAALRNVSPVVEPAELGRAYVGTGGVERLYGAPEKVAEAIQMRSAECGVRNFSEGSFASLRLGKGKVHLLGCG